MLVFAGICHLCRAVLCCAVLCCAALCCAVLCFAVHSARRQGCPQTCLGSPVHLEGTLTWSPGRLVVQMYNRFLRQQLVQRPQTYCENPPCLDTVSYLRLSYILTLSHVCTPLARQWHASVIQKWPLHSQNPSGGADIILQACWRPCLAFETCLLRVKSQKQMKSPTAFSTM